MPSSPTRGVVFEFAVRGVPVVHLLFVKGLARDNGLPFDPVPLPPIGEGAVYRQSS
jgi:poly-gamma-glutamate system protein